MFPRQCPSLLVAAHGYRAQAMLPTRLNRVHHHQCRYIHNGEDCGKFAASDERPWPMAQRSAKVWRASSSRLARPGRCEVSRGDATAARPWGRCTCRTAAPAARLHCTLPKGRCCSVYHFLLGVKESAAQAQGKFPGLLCSARADNEVEHRLFACGGAPRLRRDSLWASACRK